jgi:MFS family permease
MHFGWAWLCLAAAALNGVMAFIAARLPEAPRAPRATHETTPHRWIEWRVMLMSAPLFLYSYGYGAITSFSALYAERLGIMPKSIYLTTLALTILLARPALGQLGDRVGFRPVFVPSLVVITAGLTLLALFTTRGGLIGSAIVFGIGYGTAYPVFATHVAHSVDEHRRGAAFGAILAAFDTGIGTGSTLTGWLVGHHGFAFAFAVAAALSALAVPIFFATDRAAGFDTRRRPARAEPA